MWRKVIARNLGAPQVNLSVAKREILSSAIYKRRDDMSMVKSTRRMPLFMIDLLLSLAGRTKKHFHRTHRRVSPQIANLLIFCALLGVRVHANTVDFPLGTSQFARMRHK